MKQKQEILAALRVLDQFAANTELPRQWHAQWQSLFNQVATKVEETLDPDEVECPPDEEECPSA